MDNIEDNTASLFFYSTDPNNNNNLLLPLIIYQSFSATTNSLRFFIYNAGSCVSFFFPLFVLTVMWEFEVVFQHLEVLRLLSRAMDAPHFEV